MSPAARCDSCGDLLEAQGVVEIRFPDRREPDRLCVGCWWVLAEAAYVTLAKYGWGWAMPEST